MPFCNPRFSDRFPAHMNKWHKLLELRLYKLSEENAYKYYKSANNPYTNWH